MVKNKKDLAGKSKNSELFSDSDDLWKPVCRDENKALGKCMPKSEALAIIREHEKENITHVVDIEKC